MTIHMEMEYSNGKQLSSKEALEAQAHLWNLTYTFIDSMALKCALELGIPEAIHSHGKPITLSDLATSVSIPGPRLPCFRRLMLLLVRSGLLGRNTSHGHGQEKEDVYFLTPSSTLLVKGEGWDVSPFVRLMLDTTFLKPWLFLGSWFRAEEPATAYEIAHGMGVWADTGRRAEYNEMMNVGMESDARFTAKLIIRECGEVFRGLRSLVDVGGGTGALARAIGEAFPEVKCTVFDLPHVVEQLEESDALRVVGGDMFEHIPPADATLLKWVLHDWSDEECVKILKRCKEATPSKKDGGKVIIIEMVMNCCSAVDATGDNEGLAETQVLFDLHMMAHTTGKQRYEHEWKKIFTDAGFIDYKIAPALGLRSVIEVYH